MADRDPVRDLNNFLQGQPGGNATRDFKWLSAREGPEHDTVYHVTAVCKHCDNISLLFIHSYTKVRGVNVGVGHGSTKSIAKRNAALQALEYLKTHGEVPPTTPIGRISDLEIFSTAGIVTEREIDPNDRFVSNESKLRSVVLLYLAERMDRTDPVSYRITFPLQVNQPYV
jgi:Double-stranded RNA binding motif